MMQNLDILKEYFRFAAHDCSRYAFLAFGSIFVAKCINVE